MSPRTLLTAEKARQVFTRQVGPRRPGGVYHCVLLSCEYTVLDIHFGPDVLAATDFDGACALTIQPHIGERPGPHFTLWDWVRDVTVADPSS